MSNPNQKPIIGTRAKIGTVCVKTAHGYNDLSIHFAWLIRRATENPNTNAIESPIKETFVVRKRPLRISSLCFGTKNPS